MSQPLVTVMIPTYNQQDTLGIAIESALKQTYKNIEIVVSDDASPIAEVAALLSRYKNAAGIKIYKNSRNIGRVANYHASLYERASGEWIVNLDGDDFFYDPSFIEKAVALAGTHPSLVMISGQCIELMPDGTMRLHSENAGKSRVMSPVEAYGAIYDKQYLPFHGSTLYRRNVSQAIGFYASDTITSDFQSLLKLIQAGDVGIVASEAVVHRTHDSNASVNMTVEEWIDNAGVFFAPLDDIGCVESLVSADFLREWVNKYSYREGRSIAYAILKKHGSNQGYREYVETIRKYSPEVAFKILCQPKNILRYLSNALGLK